MWRKNWRFIWHPVFIGGSTSVVQFADLGVGQFGKLKEYPHIAIPLVLLSSFGGQHGIEWGIQYRNRKPHIETILKGALREVFHLGIPKLKSKSAPEVRINAFVVTRTGLWPRTETQNRIARWCIDDGKRPSGIKWTKGKGLIGQCWEQEQDVFINIVSEYGRFDARKADKKTADALRVQWYLLDQSKRLGLSWDELQKSFDYGAIFATPIFDGEKQYLGCVSMDTPAATADIKWAEKHQSRVFGVLRQAGLSISLVL